MTPGGLCFGWGWGDHSGMSDDATLLSELKKARLKLVGDIAAGKSVRRISFGSGVMVEAPDVDKLLMQLDNMIARYESRVEGRQGGVLCP